MKKNLRKITITVTPQTPYHLQALADEYERGNLGRAVDMLVKNHRVTEKKIKEIREAFHVPNFWKL